MKKIFFLIAFVLGMNAVFAQKSHNKSITPAARAEKATVHLTKVMALSPEQSDKVRLAVTNRISEMSTLREKNLTDKKQFHAERKKIKNTWEAELKTIVTPEQMQKYEAMKKDIKEKNKVKKNNSDKNEDRDDDGL